MRILKLGAVLLLGWFAVPAFASPYVALLPPSLNVSGPPGGVIGWGFTIHSDDTLYLEVNSVALSESYGPPAFGSWTDFLAGASWPASGFYIDPGFGDFTVPYSPGTAGLGEYTIDPGTAIGLA